MLRAGREGWKRIACLVLVAVIAAFSLPLGASAVTHPVDATPAQRAHIKRLHVEARPVTTTRRSVERAVAVLAVAVLVAALVFLGRAVADDRRHLAWAPALLPVSRGPPSLR